MGAAYMLTVVPSIGLLLFLLSHRTCNPHGICATAACCIAVACRLSLTSAQLALVAVVPLLPPSPVVATLHETSPR